MIIITGEEGLEHGYADCYRTDGVFEYFGEGQFGDVQLHKGNRAIATHSEAGKSLLLFRNTAEGLRFEGEMAGKPPKEPTPVKPDSYESVAQNWIKRHVKAKKLRSQKEIERMDTKALLLSGPSSITQSS